MSKGTVEVCHDNQWGTICNSGFGANEAAVICNQLEFPTLGKYILISFFDLTVLLIIQMLLLFMEHFKNLVPTWDLSSFRC